MGKAQKSLADLKTGEKGVICCFKDEEMSLKLMEMGCLPGTEVKVGCMAPFKGPICINVSGYNLSLRMDEAATILLREK